MVSINESRGTMTKLETTLFKLVIKRMADREYLPCKGEEEVVTTKIWSKLECVLSQKAKKKSVFRGDNHIWPLSGQVNG